MILSIAQLPHPMYVAKWAVALYWAHWLTYDVNYDTTTRGYPASPTFTSNPHKVGQPFYASCYHRNGHIEAVERSSLAQWHTDSNDNLSCTRKKARWKKLNYCSVEGCCASKHRTHHTHLGNRRETTEIGSTTG